MCRGFGDMISSNAEQVTTCANTSPRMPDASWAQVLRGVRRCHFPSTRRQDAPCPEADSRFEEALFEVQSCLCIRVADTETTLLGQVKLHGPHAQWRKALRAADGSASWTRISRACQTDVCSQGTMRLSLAAPRPAEGVGLFNSRAFPGRLSKEQLAELEKAKDCMHARNLGGKYPPLHPAQGCKERAVGKREIHTSRAVKRLGN